MVSRPSYLHNGDPYILKDYPSQECWLYYHYIFSFITIITLLSITVLFREGNDKHITMDYRLELCIASDLDPEKCLDCDNIYTSLLK